MLPWGGRRRGLGAYQAVADDRGGLLQFVFMRENGGGTGRTLGNHSIILLFPSVKGARDQTLPKLMVERGGVVFATLGRYDLSLVQWPEPPRACRLLKKLGFFLGFKDTGLSLVSFSVLVKNKSATPSISPL